MIVMAPRLRASTKSWIVSTKLSNCSRHRPRETRTSPSYACGQGRELINGLHPARATMSAPEVKAAFGFVPCEVAKVPNADIGTATTVECTVLH